MHDAGQHLTILTGRDAHRVLRDAVEVVDRAVDWVDDPLHPAGAREAGTLLAEETVAGPRVEQRGSDQSLRRVVHRGHHVGRAGLRGQHLDLGFPGARWLARGDECAGPPGDRDRRGRAAPADRCRIMTVRGAWRRRARSASPRQRAPVVGRAGWGSSRPGIRRGSGPSAPAHVRSVGSARSVAARSSTRSRTIATNRGSVPAVAARANGRPSRAAVAAASVSRSYPTSMWSETNPIGTTTTAGTPVSGERLEVVVHVGLEPWVLRRTAPAAVHQVPGMVASTGSADPLGDQAGGLPVLRLVRAAVGTAGLRPSPRGSSA